MSLPSSYLTRSVEESEFKSRCSIVIGGANFRYTSSREHASVALGATGTTTGDVVIVELGENKLINHIIGKEYKLKPVGNAELVIKASGIFAYARKTRMIPSKHCLKLSH
ncbi:hypothetical protein Ancab_033273 [Ancistrocladus abbreviatus]